MAGRLPIWLLLAAGLTALFDQETSSLFHFQTLAFHGGNESSGTLGAIENVFLYEEDVYTVKGC